MTAFADLAKHIQMETVNPMMAAGKELSDESVAALKEATDKTVKAAKSGGKKITPPNYLDASCVHPNRSEFSPLAGSS